MADLVMNEICPKYGTPMQLVTDNEPENVNRVMSEVQSNLNIVHVTTSLYHPQGNSKVERFHRTL